MVRVSSGYSHSYPASPLKPADRKIGYFQCSLPAAPGAVSVSPFFAKNKASNLAGSVLLRR